MLITKKSLNLRGGDRKYVDVDRRDVTYILDEAKILVKLGEFDSLTEAIAFIKLEQTVEICGNNIGNDKGK